jgi:hypothetical protein
MLFAALNATVDLSLTTPLEHCCNCGKRKAIELFETPLRRTRYFFFAGTELTLNEFFPYCSACAGSAGRVRLGWGSKMLSFCLVTAIVFLVLVLGAASLPALIGANLFTSAVVLAAFMTAAYFYIHEWGKAGSTYYQPVSLVSADLHGEMLRHFKLRFYNRQYAEMFTNANAVLISAGMLEVDIDSAHAH